MRRTRVIGVAAVAVALAGCGGGDEADAGATLACRGFRQVATDYEKLTRSELRDRLSDVDDDAQLSDEPGVATSARALVVALTSGTEAQTVEAINSMGNACQDAGL